MTDIFVQKPLSLNNFGQKEVDQPIMTESVRPARYETSPVQIHQTATRAIADFTGSKADDNIDTEVVKAFGEEWNKFHKFSPESIAKICAEYFDIIDSNIVNRETYMIDIGCGSGRWSEYFLDKAGFIEAVDPSEAIFAADKLLKGAENIRLTRASVNTLPWPDETFDFGMSIGVLHHIPNTQLAMNECVKKIKKGGYFYTYLYYALDNRGLLFRSVFFAADKLRKVVSKMPSGMKKFTCDVLAVVAYMPFVLTARFFNAIGMKKLASRIPLAPYANKDFYIIRNDALDRFGTTLEQRFTRQQVETMMKNSGLTDIRFGEDGAYWHAVGRKA